MIDSLHRVIFSRHSTDGMKNLTDQIANVLTALRSFSDPRLARLVTEMTQLNIDARNFRVSSDPADILRAAQEADPTVGVAYKLLQSDPPTKLLNLLPANASFNVDENTKLAVGVTYTLQSDNSKALAFNLETTSAQPGGYTVNRVELKIGQAMTRYHSWGWVYNVDGNGVRSLARSIPGDDFTLANPDGGPAATNGDSSWPSIRSKLLELQRVLAVDPAKTYSPVIAYIQTYLGPCEDRYSVEQFLADAGANGVATDPVPDASDAATESSARPEEGADGSGGGSVRQLHGR